jgi:MinD-like ATPase involved in chromosome partitioning or flagellar assembly
VVVGGDAGWPILLSHPDSPVSQAFRDIAGAMAARLSTLSLEGSPNFQADPLLKMV